MIRSSLVLVAGIVLLGHGAQATLAQDVHQVEWFVHIELIDAGAGEDLAFWQAFLDDATQRSSALLEGGHGPADHPCCQSIQRTIAVQTFGTIGDGLDVLDSTADYTAIAAIGLPGSRGFLVDSMTWCGGPAPAAIGCAQTPLVCDGTPDDDPDRYMVVTRDAISFGSFAKSLAHERGHNSCLDHVDVDECQLMRPGNGGGCVDATECANFSAGRQTTGGTCTCHAALGDPELDGTACTGVTGGTCSSGLCGDSLGDAGLAVLGAGGPEFGQGATTDDALYHSGLPGGWRERGPMGAHVKGLAYATDSGILYGVVPSGADDLLVEMDPGGIVTATVGTIANGTNELVALAYDPGPTAAASDDLLLALETDGSFEDLLSIDPDTPNSTTFIGSLAFGAADGFRGLAYDSANDKIYTSSPFADGIYEIDTSTCPFFCSLVQQTGLGAERIDSSLAYSSDTGNLYLVGTQVGVAPLGRILFYDSIDPVTWTSEDEARNVGSYTPGGLAVVPVPEPSVAMGLVAGGVLLAGLARRRR